MSEKNNVKMDGRELTIVWDWRFENCCSGKCQFCNKRSEVKFVVEVEEINCDNQTLSEDSQDFLSFSKKFLDGMLHGQVRCSRSACQDKHEQSEEEFLKSLGAITVD